MWFSCLCPCVCWCPEALVEAAEVSVFWTGPPAWIWEHSLSLNPAVVEGGKACFTVHPPWVNPTPQQGSSISLTASEVSPSPTRASSLPKLPQQEQPGRQLPQRRARGANKPKLQAHILEQVLFVFWIKLAFLGWGDPANSVPTLHKKDYTEPQIKDEHIRHWISQFSASCCFTRVKKRKWFIYSLVHRKDDIIIIRININSYGTFSVRIH